MADETELNTPETPGPSPTNGGNALGRLQGLFGARHKPASTLGGGSAIQVMIGGKAKMIIPGAIVLVLLMGAIFFVISAVAVYASRLGSIAGYGGGPCNTGCQGAFDSNSSQAKLYAQESTYSGGSDNPSQIAWVRSDEGKNYAINTLGIPSSQMVNPTNKEVEDMIRAEVASQFPGLADKFGSTQEMAQRAILTYASAEFAALDLFDSNGRPAYNMGSGDPNDHCTQLMSLTDDKFTSKTKNKRVAASYDIHYNIYLGVQEAMAKFSCTSGKTCPGTTVTGLARWRVIPAYVWLNDDHSFWEGKSGDRALPFWNNPHSKGGYADETPYACVTTGGTGGSGGGTIPAGATDFLHENIAVTTFGNWSPSSTRPHHCSDSGDTCETAYGMATGSDAPTPNYASLPAHIKGCGSSMTGCARIEATNPSNGKSLILVVIEVGPWNGEGKPGDPYATDDKAYVFGTARPQAESGKDLLGTTTNKAGLDIGPEAMKALGNPDKVNWKFTTQSASASVTADPCAGAITSSTISGKTIVIDPGHYSNYNAFSYAIDGINNEGDHNWLIANKVKSLLTTQGYSVLLTRNSVSEQTALSSRVDFANNQNANLYVSLHSNDSGGPGPWGIIWCPRPEGEFNHYLDDITMSGTLATQSRAASRIIVNQVRQTFELATPLYKCGNLGMLRGLKMPGFVLEMFAHDKSSDLEKIKGREDTLAKAIADGIALVVKK